MLSVNQLINNSNIKQSYRRADARAARVRFACFKKISIPADSIFSSQPLPQSHRSCDAGTMFKLLFRVRFGSRWLLAGVRTSGSPFFMGVVRCGVVDYTVRLFWLELSFSELPF